MLAELDRRDCIHALEVESPEILPWWHGLTTRTANQLRSAGFDGRQDCAALAAEDLMFFHGSVVLKDSDHPEWWRYTRKRFPISVVNEVRAWLGCAPYAKVQRKTPDAELDRARKLLERNGWRVDPPKN
jgi:hypothetical protein